MAVIIPLPFIALWGIMLAGVLTNMFAKMKNIVDKTPEDIMWNVVFKRFLNREWPSYCMSIIFTCVIAYSFVFMKRFQKIDNEEISYWAKWIPLSVLILYIIGVINNWIFYYILGRIQSKGKIDMDILTKPKDEQ